MFEQNVKKSIYALTASIFLVTICLVYYNVMVTDNWYRISMNRQWEKRYQKCLGLTNSGSLWFKKKMRNVGNPFWSEQNLGIDKESYKWWITLQPQKPDNLEDAMKELFELGIVSNRTRLTQDESDCISCAVVGSSDNLLEDEYGKFIDSHNYVIRFNRAITKGFEKHVGSKTTHQLMYPESAFADLNENISFVLVPFKPNDVRWLAHALQGRPFNSRWYAKPPSKLNCSIPKISVIHPSFIRFSYSFLISHKGRYPSTGFIGLMLALHQCDKVNVFGYGANSHGQWLHYYGPRTYTGQHTDHNDQGEKEVIKKLEEEGIITFFLPRKHQEKQETLSTR